jgi:dolichol-phosphate mannosyltransferase
VLYVVDRGTDRSLDLLRALAGADPAVSVLSLSSRFGQQAALLAGLDHSDADAVVMLDSDLQHPPP